MPGMTDSTETRREKYKILGRLEALGVEVNTSLAHKMYLSDLRQFLTAAEEATKR